MDDEKILIKLDSALNELAESENGICATQGSEKHTLLTRIKRDGYALINSMGYGDDTCFIITQDGCKHYRIGGYCGEIRKERLMAKNIEASIKSFKISKRVSILTLIIAVLTFFTLFYQTICL